MTSSSIFTGYLLYAVAAGVAIGFILITMHNIAASQRRRRWEQRRDELVELARKRGLTQLERIPKQLEECATVLGGQGRRLGLEDVLAGHDGAGNFYLVRRRVRGEEQQALLFENKLLTIHELRVVPMRRRPGGWLGRMWQQIQRRPIPPMRVKLEWEVKPDRLDERTALIANGLLVAMAGVPRLVESHGLHFEVQGQRAAIFTRRPLEGEALPAFLDACLELRLRVLEAPRQSGALRLSPGDSKKVRPVESSSSSDTDSRKVPYGALATVDQLEGADEKDTADLMKTRKITMADIRNAPDPDVTVLHTYKG